MNKLSAIVRVPPASPLQGMPRAASASSSASSSPFYWRPCTLSGPGPPAHAVFAIHGAAGGDPSLVAVSL